jgi:hypothetical protein
MGRESSFVTLGKQNTQLSVVTPHPRATLLAFPQFRLMPRGGR